MEQTNSESTSSSHGTNTPATSFGSEDLDSLAEGVAQIGPSSTVGDGTSKHLKLQYLIQQSSVYVNLLSERVRQQQAAQRKSSEKAAAKAENKQTGQSASTAATTTTTTRRSTRGATTASIPPPTKGVKKQGRSTRAKKGTDISDYFNKEDLDVLPTTTTEALAEAANEDSKLGEHKNLRSARQPESITGGVMKDYQLEGLEWLVSLYENGLNGILADEMGLGKTLQTISFLAFLREKGVWGPFLVVGPVSVLSSWVDEIGRWAPDMPRILYHGTPPERAEIRRTKMGKLGPEFPIVCTNYEMVMNDKKFLSKYGWKFIIIDEGHRLKNMNCKLVRELKSYDSANRLLLTGTPLQNNLAELWSLLNFLLPEIFDDYAYFEDYFDFSKLQGKDKESHAAFLEEEKKNNIVGSLHALLKPFLLRRVKTDVETNLPPKKEYVLYAPLSQTQKDLYGALLDHKAPQWLHDQVMRRHPSSKKRKLDVDVDMSTPKKAKTTPEPDAILAKRKKAVSSYREMDDDEYFDKLEEGELGSEPEEIVEALTEYEKGVMQALRQVGNKKLQNLLMQLRQACNSPHLFYWPWEEEKGELPDESIVTESGKMMLLERLVPELIKRGHKILIFSQFKKMLDIIEDWAEYLHKWEVCRLDGGVSQDIRREQIRKFNNEDKARIFLLTTRAGGLGINLTSSDTVIIFDSDWNPQMDLQAQDRAHRIGQTKPVVIYRFATANTVEQTLLDKADGKRRLEKLIIQKGKFKSLKDGPDDSKDEELSSLLLKEDFEKVNVVEKGQQVLTDEELEALLDRSPEAFAKKSVGGSGDGKAAVRVV